MSVVFGKRAWRVGLGVLGGLCLVAVIASAAAGRSYSTATTYLVDHQLCYSASGKFKIPLTATGAPVVRLKNQFSPAGFVPIIKPGLALHCNPVMKTIQTPSGTTAFKVTNPAAHVACLPMTAQTAQPTPKVVVANQFGSATLVPRQPNLVCLPSWKASTSPPRKTPSTPPGLSHFTCYPVGVASGAYKPPAVRLKDEFSAKSVAATVNPVPQELCVPTEKFVGKADYKIVDAATDLLCFPVSKTPIKPKVWDENQFGTSTVYLRATKLLCVPSTIPTGHLYWVNSGDGTVNVIPLGGGSATTLASGQDHPGSVAVDGTHVYWANAGDGTIKKVPVGGGAVTTLASGQDQPTSVKVDATNVYWVNYTAISNTPSGTVNEVPLGGGSVTTLASGQDSAIALAVDGTNVYWVNQGNGQVNKVPLGGGAVTTLVSNPAQPISVAVNGTHVYWHNFGDGKLNEVPLGGGSITTLATGPVHSNSSIAVDGTHVYWSSWAGGGTLNEVLLGGGSVTTLATALGTPLSVAVDSTHVYWVDQSLGTVNEVPIGGGIVTALATGQNTPTALAVGP